MSEFVKRTISGTIFVACIVTCILWNQWTVSGLVLLISLLAVDEFHRLVKSHILQRICAAMGTTVLWLMCVFQSFPMTLAFAAIYLPIIVMSLLDEIWNHTEDPLRVWGNMLISQAMIAFPLCTMLFLYDLDKWILLALFVLIWVNDTGAYCVGSLTAKRPKGNHKMTPHISPKKSWEGLCGGIVFTLIAGIILYFYGWFDAVDANKYTICFAILFALTTSLFGTMGDLMESLFKRSLGIKDSGHFMPGHGGVLDRFDSILLAAPILTSLSWLCYYLVPLL